MERAFAKLSELLSDCSGCDLSDSEDANVQVVQSLNDASSDEEYQPLAKRID